MTPQANIELTRRAIALRKAGDPLGAIPLLVEALTTTPNFEAAWLWLATCLESPGEVRYCLEQALNANPESQQARVGLARFEQFSPMRPQRLLTVSMDTAPPIRVAEPQAKKLKVTKIGLQVLLAFLACLAFWIGTRIGHAQLETTVDTLPNMLSAFVVCEQYVSDRLNAPSATKFARSDGAGVTIAQLDDANYRVRAYVDTQNSFAVIVRTKYDCLVRYTGNQNWRLVNLTLDQ